MKLPPDIIAMKALAKLQRRRFRLYRTRRIDSDPWIKAWANGEDCEHGCVYDVVQVTPTHVTWAAILPEEPYES